MNIGWVLGRFRIHSYGKIVYLVPPMNSQSASGKVTRTEPKACAKGRPGVGAHAEQSFVFPEQQQRVLR